MAVLIKIGRRVQKKFTSRLKGPMVVQSAIWKNIEYGFGLMVHGMKKYQKKHPDIFSYTKSTYKEEDSLNYNIQWIKIIINSTPEIEEEEYNEAMKLYSEIENNKMFKKGTDGMEIDEELAAQYSSKVKKGKMKKMMDAGYDKIKKVTLNKSLNDVGIITIVEKYKEEELEE